MIFAEVKQFKPVADSVEPALWVQADVRPESLTEMPISFTARLRLGGKTLIGGIAQGMFGGSGNVLASSYVLVPGVPPPTSGRTMHVEFEFPLSPREIDRIQQEREPDPHADIRLTLAIQAQVLDTKMRAFPIDYVAAGTEKNIVAFHQPSLANPGDVLLARADDAPLRFLTEAATDAAFVIPASHWVRTYAPAFGIGKFLVVDIPELESSVPPEGELATRVNGAIDALTRMQQDIRKGEWTQCAEDSRPVLELLNQPALLRPLLKTAGLPQANEDALLEGLRQVYTYSHAFHHRVEDGGKVTEAAVNADSEDAYLAFTTAAALLNLVARKLKRRAGAKPG